MKWLLIHSDGTVGRTCDAPDKDRATDLLRPEGKAFVVSAASWAVSKLTTVGDPVTFQDRQGPQATTREARPRLHQRVVGKAEAKRRWKERLMADPVRWAEYLERKRQDYRARKAS
jgi:hypothetical protein